MEYCKVSLGDNCHLRGKVVYALESETAVATFLGIPYAEPPISDRRFRPSVMKKSQWFGQREAIEFGPACPQDADIASGLYGPFPVPMMDENCLHLNIWAPRSCLDTGGLPVIVYIHGGSFLWGFSNMHNGTVYAAYEKVIFISVNYRLGPLGFMYTGDGVCEGNMAVTDVLSALSWVKTYISHFGGDPNNVTCMGQSAGSLIVSLLLTLPEACGLFHRAISQSGVQVDSTIWTAQQASKFTWKRLTKMGYKGKTPRELQKYLTDVPIADLLKHFSDGGSTPVLDGSFFQEHPRKVYQEHRTLRVPYLLGYTSSDGYRFAETHYNSVQNSKITKDEPDTFRKAVQTLLFEMFRNSASKAGLHDDMLQRYNLAHEDERGASCLMQRFTDMVTDGMYASQTAFAAVCHSAHSPVYVYKFDQTLPMSNTKIPGWVRCCHSDDLAYTIGYPFLTTPHPYRPTTPAAFSGKDKSFCLQVISKWANFARIGNPNSPLCGNWDQFSGKHGNVLIINENMIDKKEHMEFSEETHYWNSHVYPLLGYPSLALTAKY